MYQPENIQWYEQHTVQFVQWGALEDRPISHLNMIMCKLRVAPQEGQGVFKMENVHPLQLRTVCEILFRSIKYVQDEYEG